MAHDPATQTRWTSLWIPIGSGLFLVALTISALTIPELRLLHLLQALIYVAVIILARRNNPWGFGAGFTMAVAWNGLNMFVTHLTQAGAVAFWSYLRTGHVQRLDTVMVTLGTIAHFVLIVACLAGLLDLKMDNRKWWKFAGGGLITLAYFALIVVIAAPR